MNEFKCISLIKLVYIYYELTLEVLFNFYTVVLSFLYMNHFQGKFFTVRYIL